jgi:gliding motility-associated-like protein
MRKIYFLLLLLLFTLSPRSYAVHLYGGDLLYQHVSGNTYRIMVVLYGDCGSLDSNTFNTLKVSSPQIYIYNGATPAPSYSLDLPIDTALSDIDVTPVCPEEANNTRCKSLTTTLPGIKKFVYYDTVTLSQPSANWRFVFTGRLYYDPQTTQTISAGRSISITNIVFGGGLSQVMYLVATLNNLTGPNSSPVYTTVPTPFYCINIPQQYNQGASDPDADSLSFELVPGLVNNAPIGYNFSYSATTPLATDTFSFNNLNGQMAFTPNILQKSLVVNEVREYKNGVLVGTSMREMTFIVLDDCQNQPPDGNLANHGSNITGGVHDGNNVINVCYGSSTTVSFTISPADQNSTDTMILTAYNVPTGASVTILNNNTSNPTVNFNWDISAVPAGIYTFYINYKDDGCPLSSNQTIAYTIQIAGSYQLSAEVTSETQCYHKAAVRYYVSGGILPRTITITQGSTVVKTITDTATTIFDSLAAGNYTITVSSPGFSCDTSINLFIPDSGTYPFSGAGDDLSVCIGSTPLPLPVEPATDGTINWFDVNGDPIPGAPTYQTDTAGTFAWYVSQTVNVCTSDTDAIQVTVNPSPNVQILNKAGKVCYADRIYLAAQGGISYQWLPADKLQNDADGRQYAFVTEPTTYSVIGTDEDGCTDTASVIFSEIEKCCNFGYPNAFTPNGDGKNDRFRPILYGNMEDFELSVYNRFGERVYHSKDAAAGWDGYYKGQLCDVGMYYFRVKAKCYTGQTEEHADAVDLLR